MDPTYPLFPVFAFLGFFLVLIPLPWHLEAWNSSTCYFMIWVALGCLNQFVNSIVWADNAMNLAPIWCDISTRIITAAAIGIPAASLCINRRLYLIANVHAVTVTRAEKRRLVLIDTLICVVFPLLVVILSYIVQGHRFNILGDVGCANAFYNTLAAYFLVSWWPLILGLISAVYCVLSLISFAKRRAQFQQFLSSKSSSLSFSRYFRLMALACTELCLSVPLSTFIIYINLTAQPLGPWRSWADTHLDFSRVDLIPSILWRASPREAAGIELSRWINPACAFIFFAYFGFAEEARRNYSKFWARPIGRFSPKLTGSAPCGFKSLHSLRILHINSVSPSSSLPEKSKSFAKFMDTPSQSTPTLPLYSPPPTFTPPLPSHPNFTSRRDSVSSISSHKTSSQTVYITPSSAQTISSSPTSSSSPHTPSTAQGAYSITMTELDSLSSSRLGVESFLASEFGGNRLSIHDYLPRSPSICNESSDNHERSSFRAL